jgi:hypothetical protein
MKRTRDDFENDDFDKDVVVSWTTREGKLNSIHPKTFLDSYSSFFEALFRFENKNVIEVNFSSYPKDVVRSLIKHLDGEFVNLTVRKEKLLAKLVDFLLLKEEFAIIQNEGYEDATTSCAWCTQKVDGSICLAKRYCIFNDQMICAMCCDPLDICNCDWPSFKNKHCDDMKWVNSFKNSKIHF